MITESEANICDKIKNNQESLTGFIQIELSTK